MNKASLFTLVRQRLGFNNSLSEDILNAHLDGVQADYEGAAASMPMPWFLFETTTLSVASGNREVKVPSSFVKFDDNFMPTLLDSDNVESGLERKIYSELQPNVSDEGKPCYYAFDGIKFYLFPKPDAAYRLKVPHYRRSPRNWSEDTENSWFDNFPNLIREEMILSLARANRDKDAARLVSLDEQRRNYIIRVEEMRHQMMNYQLSLGV